MLALTLGTTEEGPDDGADDGAELLGRAADELGAV